MWVKLGVFFLKEGENEEGSSGKRKVGTSGREEGVGSRE